MISDFWKTMAVTTFLTLATGIVDVHADRHINLKEKRVEMWYVCGNDTSRSHPVKDLKTAAVLKKYIESHAECLVTNMYWVERSE